MRLQDLPPIEVDRTNAHIDEPERLAHRRVHVGRARHVNGRRIERELKGLTLALQLNHSAHKVPDGHGLLAQR